MGKDVRMVRIWGSMTEERAKQMKAWAKELGLTQTSFVSMASWLGARELIKRMERPASQTHLSIDAPKLDYGE